MSKASRFTCVIEREKTKERKRVKEKASEMGNIIQY